MMLYGARKSIMRFTLFNYDDIKNNLKIDTNEEASAIEDEILLLNKKTLFPVVRNEMHVIEFENYGKVGNGIV